MLGVTHLTIGAGLGVPLAVVFDNPALIIVSTIAALLPDLDASEATIKHLKIDLGKGKRIKPFYLLSEIVSLFFPHRGFLHSIYSAILLSLLVGIITFIYQVGWLSWTLAVFIGYLSHLLADSCTPAGVPMFLKGKWHLLPEKLRIKTGSYIEHLLSAIMGLIVIYYLIAYINSG